MKVSNSLVILVLAGAAFAQAPKGLPPAPKPAVAAKPTMPATSPTTKKSAAKPGAKIKHAVKVAEKKPTPAPAKTDAAKEPENDAAAKTAPEIKRGRDPFVSVVVARESGMSCAGSGKKCLIIDQVMLKGIVRAQAGAIAVVTSAANKTYFLRENDPVYNGVVVKITPDSIVFRETVTDRLGKSIQREVVKKVNNPAV